MFPFILLDSLMHFDNLLVSFSTPFEFHVGPLGHELAQPDVVARSSGVEEPAVPAVLALAALLGLLVLEDLPLLREEAVPLESLFK